MECEYCFKDMPPNKTEDENSLLYWLPKIKKLGIPVPRTEILKLPFTLGDWYKWCDGEDIGMAKYVPEIKKKALLIGYPLFLRTDHLSGKHRWKDTCYVKKEEVLMNRVSRLVEESLTADIIGVPIHALVFREFIEMDSRFTAFYGEMPVNPERRYFIRNGQVLCRHPYWIDEAVEKGTPKGMLPDNWRELAKEMNKETEEEIELLTSYAEKVASILDGYWSVDFCKAKDGRWILIDCGLGYVSWHPKCRKSLTPTPKDVFEGKEIEKVA